jgi:hypothetical protein
VTYQIDIDDGLERILGKPLDRRQATLASAQLSAPVSEITRTSCPPHRRSRNRSAGLAGETGAAGFFGQLGGGFLVLWATEIGCQLMSSKERAGGLTSVRG